MTRGYILTCTKIFLNTAVSCENFLLLITRIFFFGSLHLFIQFSYWKFIGVISVDLSISLGYQIYSAPGPRSYDTALGPGPSPGHYVLVTFKAFLEI